VLVNEFEPSRTFKRVLKTNAKLVGQSKTPVPSAEQYSLFRQYLDARHADGGMVDMTVLDYSMMVEDSHVRSRLVEYRLRGPDSFLTGRGEGPLIAVALTDVLSDGLSMVYSFYDPELATEHSLGTYLILDHIERARRMGLPYVYLGYWVDGAKKMDYKRRFLPQERLMQDGWKRFEE
jgi:arginyl-tRNA--protein-N-Asp/Glu arginylyltransferase